MIAVSISLYITLFISFFILVKNIVKYKELNYTNPFFYFFVCVIFYFGIPSIFVREINYYYSWSLTEDDMLFSNILASIIILIGSSMFYFFKNMPLNKYNYVQASAFIKLVWILILTYLIFIVFIKFQAGTLIFSTTYTGTEDSYKLKNLSYLLVTISVVYFFEKKSFFVFIPNMLVAVLDLLEGSRTVALIALIPVFICYAIHNKKTYLGLIAILFTMLISVGIFRNALATEQYGVPLYINVMGEFRETYILLPILINNESFVGKGSFFDMASSIALPLLQPLRAELSTSSINSGVYAAELVGRGYGLGSNFLVELIYYGYAFIIITLPLIAIFLYALRLLIINVNTTYATIITCYSIVFIRLIVREGFFNNVMMILFVLLVYSVPFLVINWAWLQHSKRIA